MESAQDICGMTKGPRRHKETWWWNDEVAEAVREKKIKYGKWKKENTKDLNDSECQNEIFQMARTDGQRKTEYNWVKLHKRSIRESDCK